MNTYCWHSAIQIRREGPYVNGYPLHLRQGDLDGACGQHCVLMALTLLGITSRFQVENLSKARGKTLSALWNKAERNYFAGTSGEELKETLQPFSKLIKLKLLRRSCIAHTLESLNDGGIAILKIDSPFISHWVLAIGTGGLANNIDYKPQWLLLLDPGFDAVRLSPWNAMLSIRPSTYDWHSYKTATGCQRVNIPSVLTIRKIHSVKR